MSDLFKYAKINEAPIFESVSQNKGKKTINRILLGTYVKIVEKQGDFFKVVTAGPDGWMHQNSLTDKMGLKVFFLDVGQGDGMLMEIGPYRILIDAGPGANMHNYLSKWQYSYLIKENKPVHIDHVFVSHFDLDHYKGFIDLLENPAFTFGAIHHAGILKFADKGNPYNTGLGDTVPNAGQKHLTRIFDDLLQPNEPAEFNRDVSKFMKLLAAAKTANRVGTAKRLKAGDVVINEVIDEKSFKIEVLAPFTETVNGAETFVYWEDEGKTINGHSLVLKVTFGKCSFLFGGDLNTHSENYLMKKYGAENPFRVDVAKSCHHGSSDFTEDFMEKVKPYATVISSGDNEMFSHPRADAIGCAGRYTRGKRPLVYSTELARSTNLTNNTILFGLINLRCNGDEIYISQMKEVKSPSNIWDAYKVDN